MPWGEQIDTRTNIGKNGACVSRGGGSYSDRVGDAGRRIVTRVTFCYFCVVSVVAGSDHDNDSVVYGTVHGVVNVGVDSAAEA